MTSRNTILPIFALGLILILAFVLRMYRLDQSPKGALIDEAHFGYIAKSLLMTGKDEHGLSWPLVFKGFGDQKLPGYGYALIPFVAIFDLSVMTIRLPSVLVGSLSVILMYALAKRVGFSYKSTLIGALLMAVSPWPFFLSRFGFESNLALFFWMIGLLCLAMVLNPARTLFSEKKWTKFLPVFTGFFFALTWYSYIAYRPVTVGVLAGLTVVAFLWHKNVLKKIAVMWMVMGIIVSPLFLPSVSAANTTRLQQVGLLSDTHNSVVIDEFRTFCDFQLPLPLCSVIWNKGTYVIQTIASRYLHVYSPEYLVTRGEVNETFLSVKSFGQFMMVVYPFVWLGLAELIVIRKKLRMTEWLLLIGLVVAPLPAILAGEPQKVRISALLPFIILVVLYGVHLFGKWFDRIEIPMIPKKFVRGAVIAGIVGLFFTATASYFVDFYTVQTIKNDHQYQSYLRDLFPILQKNYAEQQIYIKPFFSDPTMFYAFYTNMDPIAYQQQAVLGPLEGSGFQHTVAIEKVKVWDSGFLSAACKAVQTNTPTLYVTNETANDLGAVKVETIMSENGAMAYVHVYDALNSGKLAVMQCNDIPLAQRQAIAKEVEASGLRHKLLSP